ncbi:hypothetical protein ACFLUR_01735, partial [Chloroflexota bacterium]
HVECGGLPSDPLVCGGVMICTKDGCVPPEWSSDGCTENATQTCGSNVGQCEYGTQTCDSSGNWGGCVGGTGPSAEVCDDVDNNCDGSVDEGGICDSDGDGTIDRDDGCPNDANKIEPGACDCGTPDTDSDGDGFADCVDNCPDKANPYQNNSDGDDLGDACDPIYAEVDINPNVLNLGSKSNKNSVTGFIRLDEEADVSQIDVGTVVLSFNGTMVAAQLKPVSIADHDKDGTPDIMVKFSREELISVLADTDLGFLQNIGKYFGQKVDVTFTATGNLDGERYFIAEGMIKVIFPKVISPKKK